MPGVDSQSVSAAVAGFVSLSGLSVVRFFVDRAKNRINQSKGDEMKQKENAELFGYSTLETIWTIGTSSLAGALST